MTEEERIAAKISGNNLTLGMLWEPTAQKIGEEELEKFRQKK